MTRRLVGAATVLAFAAAACQLFVKITNEDGVPAEAEAGADSGPGPDPCHHQRVPPPPVPGTESNEIPPLFFAARSYSVLPPNGDRPGFDLDDRCTGDPTSTTNQSACRRPNGAPTDKDFDGGVDNVFSIIMDAINQPGDFAANLLDMNATNGFFTVVVLITGYNGEPNDDAIKLSFITAGDPHCDGCDGGKPSFEPGADEWKFLGQGQQVPEQNLTIDSVKGYVTNETLVVNRTGNLSFNLATGSKIELRRATVTGKLKKELGGFTLTDVNVGGATPVEDVLRLINNFEIGGGRLCGNPQAQFFATGVCKQRDLRANDERSDLPCDALSFAFRFDTVPAKMSTEVIEPPTGCTLEAGACPE